MMIQASYPSYPSVLFKQSYTTYWQCTVRPKGNHCKASITVRNGRFTPRGNAHNHTAQPGALLGSQIVKEVKTKATAEKFEPASAIIEAVMTDTKYCVYIIFVQPFLSNNFEKKILFLLYRCYLTACPTLHVQHSQHQLAWLEPLIG